MPVSKLRCGPVVLASLTGQTLTKVGARLSAMRGRSRRCRGSRGRCGWGKSARYEIEPL
jgi:hypothetical protein